METKICLKCSIEKKLEEYAKNINTKDGFQQICRLCNKEYKKTYYQKNKKRILDKSKNYYDLNKNYIIGRSKIWADKNKEKTDDYKKKYVRENREFINKKMSERKKNEPILKLKMLYRSKLNKILGSKKEEKTFDLIGCSPSKLKEHIENQFEIGMNWKNHGLFGWHIDHIIPLSSAKNEEEIKRLCHYTNLQPLWAIDNIRKRDKIL